MHISVSGKHIEVGQSLQGHVEERLSNTIPKYLDRVQEVNVVFTDEAHLFRCSIVLNTGTKSHLFIKGEALGGDAYSCFDAAAARIEKQLRRYKRRLKDHHNMRTAEAAEELAEYTTHIISGEHEMPEHEHENHALVIAEESDKLERLTVDQAVMKLDLQDLPVLLFINPMHGQINIVYRRADGNISWMDPFPAAKTSARKRKTA